MNPRSLFDAANPAILRYWPERASGRLNGSPSALISVEPVAASASGLFHHLNSTLLVFSVMTFLEK